MQNDYQVISKKKNNTPFRLLNIVIILISIISGISLLFLSTEVAIGGIIILISVGIIFVYPFAGLILFTLFLYLRPVDFFPALVPFHLTRVLAFTTFIIMIIRQAIRREHIFKRYPEVWLISSLVLVMFLSVGTSIWKSHSLDSAISFAKIYIAFLLIINLVTSLPRLKVLIGTMILSGFVLAAAAFASYLQGKSLVAGYRVKGMVGGMFDDPNDFALSLIILIPFTYCFILRAKSALGKLFLTLPLVALLLGTIITFSRGGMLGLAVVLILLFLKTPNRKIGLTFFLVLLLLLPLIPSQYWKRAETISAYQEDPSITTRLDAWKAGISMMIHRPLGVGIGNFGEGFVRYRLAGAIDPPGMRRASHNAFIQIGGETGILGLGIFTLLIIFTLKKLFKVRDRFKEEAFSLAQATWISLVGFIVCAFFLSQAFNWFLYYFVAFSVVLKEVSKGMESEETGDYTNKI